MVCKSFTLAELAELFYLIGREANTLCRLYMNKTRFLENDIIGRLVKRLIEFHKGSSLLSAEVDARG